MAKASNNQFPSVLFAEQGSAPAGPAAGDQRIFIDSSDHHLKRVDSAGAVVDLETDGTPDAANTSFTGSVATDWDSDTSPTDVGAALDQLAERIDDVEPYAIAQVATINFVIDGGGSAITTGIKGDVELPWAGTINQATLLADQSGSIVVDIWLEQYADFPPEDADSITAAAPPTITTATKSQDSTLSGWTTSVAAGDILRFNVDSCDTITRCTVSLKITRTA